ncbi:CGNR zinc finger domain-containing protein [Streptomyces vilmorinianum]|uniref:CGNR zinc finger domain-containing protein n=1 Tax=Streptomyces vilmorinianum TaxID=3051092 RepID=UPI0020C7E9F6|nr:ABATE domain-containing protein [Streptomyces vilmorinianum]
MQATTGMSLVALDGQRFRFDAGALCLELLLTGGPGPVAARYEVLDEPDGLLDWARRCRLGLGSRTGSGLDVTVTAAELARVRETRDALWGLAHARVYGHPFAPEDLALLNEAAARPPLVPRMTADGAHAWAPGATATALLSTVARDAIELFTGPHADRIRECGSDDCYLLFVDTSRPGRRRWCAMERCGNRHKVRAHRARTHAEGETA